MKVILLKNIPGLGRAGDLKSVAGGYARNYLIPQKLVIIATASAISNWEQKRKQLEHQHEAGRQTALILKEKIEAVEMQVVLPGASESKASKAFGSIRKEDIVKFFKEHDIDIPKSAIALDQPIKKDGEYAVLLSLGAGVETVLKLIVKVS